TLTNCESAADALADVYGGQVVIVPYVMPGFLLARECARLLPEALTAEVVGVVLMNHGIFTWGAQAKHSYDAMIDLVGRAQAYIDRHRIEPSLLPGPAPTPDLGVRLAPAQLRRPLPAAPREAMVSPPHTA